VYGPVKTEKVEFL
jgi:hypothetical protein